MYILKIGPIVDKAPIKVGILQKKISELKDQFKNNDRIVYIFTELENFIDRKVNPNSNKYIVSSVVDGDTVRLINDGEDIKLLPFIGDNYFTDTEYVNKNLNIIKDLDKYKEKYGINYLTTPILGDADIRDLYEKNMRNNYDLDCTFLKQPVINNNGDIQLCPFMRIKLGNIKNNTLDEIYNTDKYKKLIAKIYENNLLPVCERCCGIEVKK